ncbi:hypothetical protein Ddc_06680 [Ditylenchus destructor]|nr:hypothetical protein Ddc_06680 [Ditylenchus destructor]
MSPNTGISNGTVILPGYLTYLNYGETWISVIAHAITITLMAHLIFCCHFPGRISPFILRGGLSKSLLIYMYHQLFYSTASAPYHIYQVWRWRATHSEPLYDPRFLYWSGIWGMNYMWITPLVVLLLTVDRCLLLSLPLRYSRTVQSRVVWMGFGLVLLGTAVSTWLLLLELPLDVEKSKLFWFWR